MDRQWTGKERQWTGQEQAVDRQGKAVDRSRTGKERQWTGSGQAVEGPGKAPSTPARLPWAGCCPQPLPAPPPQAWPSEPDCTAARGDSYHFMLRGRIAPQSEVIEAIMFEDPPCLPRTAASWRERCGSRGASCSSASATAARFSAACRALHGENALMLRRGQTARKGGGIRSVSGMRSVFVLLTARTAGRHGRPPPNAASRSPPSPALWSQQRCFVSGESAENAPRDQQHRGSAAKRRGTKSRCALTLQHHWTPRALWRRGPCDGGGAFTRVASGVVGLRGATHSRESVPGRT